MTSRSKRSWVATLAILSFGCGGSSGGGGGGTAPVAPTLLAVVFDPSSAGDTTPSTGESITLYFSTDVSLAANAVLDDADFTLPSGKTLGTGIGAPTLPNNSDKRAVRVTLGTGASFTPGTDTIALASTQDAVLDTTGSQLGASSALTIATSDGSRPTISLLTLNAVPSVLNGSGAAGGTLQVPLTGFTIDASYADTTFSGAGSVDTAGLHLSSSKEVRRGGTALAAGTNLIQFLTGSPTATSLALTVPNDVEFPEGDQALTLTVADSTGNRSVQATFSFRGKRISNELRPFENGQRWFITLTRDVDAISSSPAGGGVVNTSSTPGSNGTADFLEELVVLGLRTATPLSNVVGSKDSNEVVLDLLKAKILTELAQLYSGVNITFTFDDPGSFPNNRAIVGYSDSGAFGSATVHSRIELGADDGAAGVDALGIAIFDTSNTSHENNTLVPGTYSNVIIQSRLGIFPHVQTASSINLIGSTFRTVFDPILDHRGTPVGEAAAEADRARLVNLNNNVVGDTRQSQIQRAINDFARFLAVLLAHECGHSVGLVKDGAQPTGLYGGDATNFAGSTSGHITFRNPPFDLFPSGATEIMSPELNFTRATNASSAFNPLILAYLRERTLYDN